MASNKFIYWLSEVTKDQNDVVGKKCANLGELTRSGFRVPHGFALSVDAYTRFLNQTGALEEVRNVLGAFSADAHDPAALGKWAQASHVLRGIVESKPMPAELADPILAHYEEMCAKTAVKACPVATRSAGAASHPGQYETRLHVRGGEEVLRNIIKVWSSTFNQTSLVARARAGLPLDCDPIGVAVLQMVNAKAAGVIFTLNPINGDRSKIMIEGSWGLGESVVSGSVTPDEWMVDKVVLEIVSRVISPKSAEYIVNEAGRVVLTDVPPERQETPCLEDREVLELARVGKRIEQHCGAPQDIEWVIDKDLTFPDSIFFVQTRPETIWSKKQAEAKLQSSGDSAKDVVHFWMNIKA